MNLYYELVIQTLILLLVIFGNMFQSIKIALVKTILHKSSTTMKSEPNINYQCSLIYGTKSGPLNARKPSYTISVADIIDYKLNDRQKYVSFSSPQSLLVFLLFSIQSECLLHTPNLIYRLRHSNLLTILVVFGH